MGETNPAVWEYQIIREAERERLPLLGREGWELVAIGGDPGEQRLYLKRPAMSLRERATLDQRARYFSSLGLDPEVAPRGTAQ